jgi:hypothetical protein
VFSSPELTVSAVFSWLRDAAIIYGILKIVWNSRGIYQGFKDFKTAILSHMKKMEGFAYRAETNHFKHMEEYLYLIAKDRNLITIMPPDAVGANDVEPPENQDV